MSDQSTIRSIREKNRLESIKRHARENLSSDLHAAVMAQQFRISVSAIHYLFREYQGQSYHNYLQEIRMNTAIQFIQTGGMTVKEAMYATGYKDRKTFTNAFKKKFNRTPGYYKK